MVAPLIPNCKPYTVYYGPQISSIGFWVIHDFTEEEKKITKNIPQFNYGICG